MSDLAAKRCIPCEGDVKPFDETQAHKYLRQVSDAWELDEGKKIKRKFEFKDFKEAMSFVNKVAEVAEEEQHHPDIKISYNKVKVSLSTHSIGGLSENDFILAAKIDKITFSSNSS